MTIDWGLIDTVLLGAYIISINVKHIKITIANTVILSLC